MTILDPVAVANLAVYLVQLPRGRPSTRKLAAAPPVEFVSLEQAHAAGEVVISEPGTVERVRLEYHGTRDLFLQAGEVLRGGQQDRAVAGDLLIPAPKHEPESLMVPTFCVEEQRWGQQRGWSPELFTLFDQIAPGRRLKKELRLGTQEDVWREIATMHDTLRDLISHGGTRDLPPYSLWTLIELLETQGWLNEYINALLPLAEANLEATGAVFVLGGKFNSAELYATPLLFRQLWPKLLWAVAVEAVIEQKTAPAWSGKLPTKGEVTAWLASVHRRGAASHTDKINQRMHRRIRSHGGQMCFETLDQDQDGLCVHEFVLPND